MSLITNLHRLCVVAAIASLSLAGSGISLAQPAQSGSDLPQIPREFRGVWVSSVYNGNWPSKPGLPVEQQKQELIAIMDQAKKTNLNAVVFQVRPGCDAMYESKLEPWSEFLTGTQGKAPEPYYDPLHFAVEEAHKRGLQLHAWLNPYRAAVRQTGSFAGNHVSHTLPNAVKRLDKLMWLDPGNDQAQKQTLSVISDIIHRYDVDGIQFDDYFYPYASEVSKTGGFPDDDSWDRYQKSGGKLSRDDWRRENVNTLMRNCYNLIKKTKPRVYFGIAPFGIWRPGYPQGIVGMDPYQQLYADSRKWLQEGWLDYFSPQLYWDLSKEGQSYPKLLAWWAEQNSKKRHLWTGISISGVGNNFPTDDILKRLEITRKQPGATGLIYFSMKPLMQDQGSIATELRTKAYQSVAIVPPSPWLDTQAPAAPAGVATRDIATGGMTVQWSAPRDPDAFLTAVYARINGQWLYNVLPPGTGSYTFPASGSIPEAVRLSSIDRMGNESAPAEVPLGGGSNAGIQIPSPVTAPPLPGAR